VDSSAGTICKGYKVKKNGGQIPPPEKIPRNKKEQNTARKLPANQEEQYAKKTEQTITMITTTTSINNH